MSKTCGLHGGTLFFDTDKCPACKTAMASIATIEKYYNAIYDAKMSVLERSGPKAPLLYCGNSIRSNEEPLPVRTFEEVCQLIESLPG